MLCSQLVNKGFTIAEVAIAMGYSKRKVSRLLVYKKVPEKIWDQVQDMSKVSCRTADTIYTLSNKGDEYTAALVECSEEIKAGVGSRKIEAMVEAIVNGEQEKIDDARTIKTPEGKVIAHWKNNTLVFEKSYSVDQDAIESFLMKQ